MEANYSEAVKDIINGVCLWDMWGRLGWAEIKRRYRRTTVGPFWTSLSLSVFVVSLGLVWSHIWNVDPKEYLPFLCSGMICWLLFSAFVSEGSMIFISNEGLIKQMRISFTMLICALIWRNLIVFFHNLVVYLIICFYANVPINAYWLAAIPGLFILCLNGMWITLTLGLLCARYRDIQQVVTSFLQVAMLVTPILWSASQLSGRRMILVDYNILYHYIEIIRDPLLGKSPAAWSWIMVVITTFAGWALALYLFSRFRQRIAYWL